VSEGDGFRWIDGPTATDEEWDRIGAILSARGWMALNRFTSRVLVAEDASGIRGLIVAQLVPHVGPLWARPSERGTGLAEDMATKMFDYLVEAQARGWVVIADSPHVPPICESHGMRKVESPVYVAK
jgi:hypothetical protein